MRIDRARHQATANSMVDTLARAREGSVSPRERGYGNENESSLCQKFCQRFFGFSFGAHTVVEDAPWWGGRSLTAGGAVAFTACTLTTFFSVFLAMFHV